MIAVLKQKALGLEELHERARILGSAWTRDQLELFLLCAPGVTRDAGLFRSSASSPEEELQLSILEAVRSFAGMPVSATQVRARLPNHFVTTDEQVLAIARRIAGLEVFGPKLIRIVQ
ncbi:hypothetical protein [Bradyrhizobium sp. SZCCHNR1015]|uniref:hypothetical protein n=1 Tax=Bradyrhizobium sp. SZCCHNR1015 TaxID=3057338 RepID=UPI002916B4F7|nr:hypothetical protein [Bradyrhizobium sp. SZCCHNR1015]